MYNIKQQNLQRYAQTLRIRTPQFYLLPSRETPYRNYHKFNFFRWRNGIVTILPCIMINDKLDFFIYAQ